MLQHKYSYAYDDIYLLVNKPPTCHRKTDKQIIGKEWKNYQFMNSILKGGWVVGRKVRQSVNP